MKVRAVDRLPELAVVEPTVHRDERGSLFEAYRRDHYGSQGLDADFVQENEIRSHRRVLRGLHFQYPRPQTRLVRVVRGAVFEVAVDVREGSPTLGRWHGIELSAADHRQFYVPGGFAHGFVALEEDAVVVYGSSAYYAPECQRTIAWDDPEIGVAWPVDDPIVSERDAAAPSLTEAREEGLLPPLEVQGNR